MNNGNKSNICNMEKNFLKIILWWRESQNDISVCIYYKKWRRMEGIKKVANSHQFYREIHTHTHTYTYMLFVPVGEVWNKIKPWFKRIFVSKGVIYTQLYTTDVYKVARIRERWTVNQKLKNESNPEGKGIPDSRYVFGRISTRLARDTNYVESQED